MPTIAYLTPKSSAKSDEASAIPARPDKPALQCRMISKSDAKREREAGKEGGRDIPLSIDAFVVHVWWCLPLLPLRRTEP